jgi:hypothetical protein
MALKDKVTKFKYFVCLNPDYPQMLFLVKLFSVMDWNDSRPLFENITLPKAMFTFGSYFFYLSCNSL